MAADRGTGPALGVPSDWFWEGNVQARIVEFLEATGWGVVFQADAARRGHGPDIDARRLQRNLLVEVKGFPSTQYRDPRRAGETKRTNPRLQARHWFAQALATAVMDGEGMSGLEIAIGLPSHEVYEHLVERCERSLGVLGIGVYFVTEDGSVIVRLGHRPRGVAFEAMPVYDSSSTERSQP